MSWGVELGGRAGGSSWDDGLYLEVPSQGGVRGPGTAEAEENAGGVSGAWKREPGRNTGRSREAHGENSGAGRELESPGEERGGSTGIRRE